MTEYQEKVLNKLDTIIEIMAYNNIKDISGNEEKVFTLIEMGLSIEKTARLSNISLNSVVEIVLNRLASSKERKMIWVLLDNERMSKEIAEIVVRSRRAVEIFLDQLEMYYLASNPRNAPPFRVIDYVPSGWVDLLPSEYRSS